METLFFKKIGEIKREKDTLEKTLSVKITITGKKVEIEGNPLEEYEALIILEAMELGFSTKKALILQQEDMVFKKIPIKDFTRRKNLYDVRARVIGSKGQTKKTLEQISGCDIVINENYVGIIGHSEAIDEVTTAIQNIIKGSKQANIYRFLESMNTARKSRANDLGLRTEKDLSKFERKRSGEK